MTDISDIEDLLEKAKKHATRMAWVKTAMVCGATMLGTAFGAGIVSGRYLGKILNGQDEMLRLVRGQDAKIKDVQDQMKTVDSRVAVNEKVCDTASTCCRDQAKRVDILYLQPTAVKGIVR